MKEEDRNNIFSLDSSKRWLVYHLIVSGFCVGWGMARGQRLLTSFINALPVIASTSIPLVIIFGRKFLKWHSTWRTSQRNWDAESSTAQAAGLPVTRRQSTQHRTAAPDKTRLRRLAYILTGIVIVVALSALGLRGILLFRTGVKVHTPTDEEVQAIVDDVNNKTTYITLVASQYSFEGMEYPKKQFEISLRKEYAEYVYLFKLHEYWIEYGGDQSQIPTATLCEMIDKAYQDIANEDKKILEALVPEIDVTLTVPIKKIVEVKLSIGDIKKVIIEILFAIRQLSRLNSSHAQVVVKGYADGYKKEFRRPLNETYKYREVEIYPPVDWNNQSDGCAYRNPNPPPQYKNQSVTLSLPYSEILKEPVYRNCDLPDLRAKFTKEVLVDPFLEGCSERRKIETRIIKGYEFSKDTKDDLQRKSQVFVLLYWN